MEIYTNWTVYRRWASPRYNHTASEPIRLKIEKPKYKLRVEFLFDLGNFSN